MKDLLDTFYNKENIADAYKTKRLFETYSHTQLQLALLSPSSKFLALFYCNVFPF